MIKFFANFDFASRPFHSFAPLKEEYFWSRVVLGNGTRRSVSVLRSTRVLVSDNLSNRLARYEGATAFYTCTPFPIFLLKSSHLLSANLVSL